MQFGTVDPPNADDTAAVPPPPPNDDTFDVEKLFPNTDAEVVAVCAKPPPPPPKADDPKTEPAVDCGEPKLVVPPNNEPPDCVGLAAALPPNIVLVCAALFANRISISFISIHQLRTSNDFQQQKIEIIT